MFSMRHFKVLAEVLHRVHPQLSSEGASVEFLRGKDAQFKATVDELCKEFKNHNPNFDTERFHAAVMRAGLEPRS